VCSLEGAPHKNSDVLLNEFFEIFPLSEVVLKIIERINKNSPNCLMILPKDAVMFHPKYRSG
jgi:hypothetical protein